MGSLLGPEAPAADDPREDTRQFLELVDRLVEQLFQAHQHRRTDKLAQPKEHHGHVFIETKILGAFAVGRDPPLTVLYCVQRELNLSRVRLGHGSAWRLGLGLGAPVCVSRLWGSHLQYYRSTRLDAPRESGETGERRGATDVALSQL